MAGINQLCKYCRDGLGKRSMEYWHTEPEEDVHGDDDAYILWVAKGRRPISD